LSSSENPTFRTPARRAFHQRGRISVAVLGLACALPAWPGAGAAAVPPKSDVTAPADAAPAPRDAATTPSAGALPPVVLEQSQATYPAEAVAARSTGDVAVALTIDAAGQVIATAVVHGVAPALDRAALEAASRWRFKPAERDGVPIASRIQLLFHFEAPSPAPAASAPARLPVAPAPSAPLPVATPIDVPAPAPATEPATTTPGTPGVLDVSVAGRRPPTSRGASDFQIRVGQLATVPHANASDLLKLAPGILLTNEGGEGHAEQVFMRGFDAREGQDVEFSVGGVPINESGNLHGNGYADTHFIIPELVQGLRVVEGPFDPAQGNYAVAGSADYELGLAERGLSLRYMTGSFGTERVVGLWGPEGQSTHTFGGVEIYKTDGFGQNRSADRGAAMSQYEGRLGSGGSYRLTAQLYSTHFHSAGIIREDDYAAGRIGFYDSYDVLGATREQVPEGGDASRASVAADLETRAGDTTLTQQVFAIKRDMRLLENFTGFLLDVQEPLQSLHAQRGDMLDLNVNELTLGARGAAHLAGDLFGRRQELELGYFARDDQAAGTQQRLEADTGVPYKTDTDLVSQLGDIGLYGDANLRPWRWLSLRGGARAEILTYDVLDNCAQQSVAHPSTTDPPIDQSCLTQQDRGRPREIDQRASTSSLTLLPRASLIAGPVRHVSLSASYGRGIRSVDPSYISQDVKTPFASARAYEVGVSFAGEVKRTTLVARSVLFRTVVDQDLIFSQTAGRNVLGVGTTRTGWLGALRWTGPFFDESANLTLVNATFNDNHQAVAYVPGAVFRSDTALFASLPWRLHGLPLRASLNGGVTYVGRRPLPYGETSDDIFTIDASATLAWSHYELRLLSTNLLNTQYRLGEYDYASDFKGAAQPTLVPERAFTAGAPHGLYLSLGINFGASS
jgi:iron complex outermembrane receptor protein